ncbi:MAG: glycosyltransferase family 39 protein [Deltaproteobacteria bacterium]|nr:glycosyltransferase family 39 protein [Deltaproteobacteria bacterium]
MRRIKLSPRVADFLIGLGLFTATLVVLVLLSRLTAIGAHEQKWTGAARAVGLWIDRAAHEGRAVLGGKLRDPMLAPVQAQCQLPALLSGYVWEVASHRHTWMTDTLGLRFGFLVFNALGVAMLYALVVQAWGRRVALFACAFYLLVPRSLHMLVGATGDGLAITAWLLLAAFYLRSLRGGSIGWTIATGAVFGLSLALSTSVLWLAGILIAHTIWARRAEAREAAKDGAITVPSALLAAIVIAPVVFLLCTPWLWNETGIRMRQLFTTSIAPSIVPTYYAGMLVAAPPLPKGFALRSVVLSLPTITVVLTGAGAAVLARRWWMARREQGEPERLSLGALIALAIVFAVAWPAISPDVLAVYPPRWILAFPWLGALAGVGLDACIGMASELLASRSARLRGAAIVGGASLILCVPAIESVRSPSTLAAAFSPLSGGARSVIESRTLPVNDAAMVAQIAPSIDEQARPSISIWAPDVGADVWDVLRANGRLRTVVRAAGNARDADMVLVSGGAGGEAVVRALLLRNGTPPALLGVVARDGAVLLSLYRVK